MEKYQTNLEDLFTEYKVDTNAGLTDSQVTAQRDAHGSNTFEAGKSEPLWRKILRSLNDVATIILLIAAVISFITAIMEGTGNYFESLLIIGIVIINTTLSIVQEGRAENSLAALQNLNRSQAKVMRNGKTELIDADDVVVGDIMVIDNGSSIPADARLLEAVELQVEESALTGESEPVQKDENATFEAGDDVDLGERINMVYRGTAVVNGHGRAVVTAVGMQTEMGIIAGLLNNETKTPLTPLQMRLVQLGKNITWIALAAAAIVMALGLYQGMDLMHIFLTAVSLAVAVVPETLAVIVTMTLALGVQKMAKKNAIIRRLPAVETLGTTSVIASDKTGTLTQNKMTAREVWSALDDTLSEVEDDVSDSAFEVLFRGAISTNVEVSTVDGETRYDGLPTEIALVHGAEKVKSRKQLLEEWPLVDQVPFNSTKKRMTTVHKRPDGGYIAITKGAFDVLLPMIEDGDKQRAEDVNATFGKNALRVLTITQKTFDEMPADPTPDFYESHLKLVGLVGIIDPPRPESAPAVEKAREAGIKTVMITGDHLETASAIAREIGIMQPGDKGMTGHELSQLTDDQLDERVRDYSVYARVTPTDKIRIVKSWQRQDAVIAMTGDGVNDAPALKAADVGISMGETGTDVARNASDIILTDDNFATIVDTVSEGRGVYVKVRKTINFLLSANLSEIFVIIIAMLLGWGSPLLPVHLLFINLVSDGLPGFALSREPMLTDVMHDKPMSKDASLFEGGLRKQIAIGATLFAIVSLLAMWFGRSFTISGLAPSHEVGQTMAFVVLSLTSIVHVFNIRSAKSAFSIKYAANPTLVNMALLAGAITLVVALVPFLAGLFGLVPLTLTHWLIIAALTAAPTVVMEVLKMVMPNNFRV